jgi:hypothetical protein
VNRLFTSFAPAPRRIARLLAFVLAVALVAANAFAAAMPLGESTPASSNPPTSHAHCADQKAATPVKHAGHGTECACGGNACACMHACDALVLAMPGAVAMPVLRGLPPRAPHLPPSGAIPPLRPPIA